MVTNALLDTTIKRTFTNGGHTVRDGDGGQSITTTKRPVSNGGHTVRDGDGGQATTIIKRLVSNGGHTVRDNGILTTNNQSVAVCFNDGITIVS